MNPSHLVPITKMKISKERWLNTKVKYEENLTVKDILEDMSTKTYEWIIDKDDLALVTDCDSFKNDFISLMYDYDKKRNYNINHMSDSEEDLYNLKYLEDINNLFLSLKKLDDYYGLNILKDDFNAYFEYMKYNTTIREFSDDEISDDEYSED